MDDLSIYIAFAAPHVAAFLYIILKSRGAAGQEPAAVELDEPVAERRVSRVYFG